MFLVQIQWGKSRHEGLGKALRALRDGGDVGAQG